MLDILDPEKLIKIRLFRENCVFFEGHYVKDLSLLDRDINQTIIVDNSPMSYIFHPENAIDCTSFFDDPQDVELWQIADFLVSIKSCPDVRKVCRYWREWVSSNPSSVPITAEATAAAEAAMILLYSTDSSSNDISYTSSNSNNNNNNNNNNIGGFINNNHHHDNLYDGVYSISSISSSSSSSNNSIGSGGNHNHKHSYL